MDARLAAALVGAGATLLVAGVGLFATPLFRWLVDRDLNQRNADYAEALEDQKSKHARELERGRQLHAHELQTAQAKHAQELSRQQSDAEMTLARHRAAVEYELEQRKALRSEVGAFRGRLIEVGNSLNFRLDNLRENRRAVVGDESSEAWLDRKGVYVRSRGDGYYFASTVYRFMAFSAVANRFERAAIYVDPRYAEPADQVVVFYVRALRWVLTDPKLFAGLTPQYQQQDATDHFFTDDIRVMCAEVMNAEGELKEVDEVKLDGQRKLEPILEFFDGLEDGSLKWDRLMAFSLMLKAFLNAIGYEQVRSSQQWFDETASSISRPEIRSNLVEWLPRLAVDSGDPYECMKSALENAGRTAPSAVHTDTSFDGAEPQA